MVAVALRTNFLVGLVLVACLPVAAVSVPGTAAMGTATAPRPPNDKPFDSGDTYCRGEHLRFEAQHPGLDGGKTYGIYSASGDERRVARLQLEEDGTAVVNTTALAGGDGESSYFVADENGKPVVVWGSKAERTGNVTEAKWTVRSGFCVTFPDESVATTDWPFRTNLVVTGNATTVVIIEDELNATQLAAIFDGKPTDDGVRVPVDDGTVPATFDYSGGGSYTFHVRAVGTNRTADAHLQLAVADAPTVFLSRTWVIAERGDVAELDLRFEDTTVVNVTVERGGFRLAATVRDADGDGRATLRVDLDALDGETEAVGVSSGDCVRGASVRGASGTLPTGDYDVRLWMDGRETTIGKLRVVRERRETTSTTVTEATTESVIEATTESVTEPTTVTATSSSSTARRTSRETVDDEPPTDGTTPGVPGFGVGCALVALAVARALRRR